MLSGHAPIYEELSRPLLASCLARSKTIMGPSQEAGNRSYHLRFASPRARSEPSNRGENRDWYKGFTSLGTVPSNCSVSDFSGFVGALLPHFRPGGSACGQIREGRNREDVLYPKCDGKSLIAGIARRSRKKSAGDVV